MTDENKSEFIRETESYRLRGRRPFKLIVRLEKSDYEVCKAFLDESEPMFQVLMRHHLSGCIKCWEIRKEVYDGIYSKGAEE